MTDTSERTIMTNPTFTEAQEYLTVAYEDRRRRILDLRRLLRFHPPEIILALMKSLLNEKKKSLKYAIMRDRSNPEINEIVSTCSGFTWPLNASKRR